MAVALIGSLTLIGAGAVTSTAEETSVALPSASFRDIVVDGVHDRAFVSDPAGGSIVVTDYTGAVVQQITAEEGAAGLVLSADSGKLDVALSTAGAIAEIDTAPLTETNRYPTGADTRPRAWRWRAASCGSATRSAAAAASARSTWPLGPRRRRSSPAVGTGSTPGPWRRRLPT
ncbi:YncE family protein [Streptomyces sp. NPDC058434]|uniref:YncE family protein n=1 Tax=Streptomyces sp. NPDC058434 TaxID=3346498 RepID=UPI00364D5C89